MFSQGTFKIIKIVNTPSYNFKIVYFIGLHCTCNEFIASFSDVRENVKSRVKMLTVQWLKNKITLCVVQHLFI